MNKELCLCVVSEAAATAQTLLWTIRSAGRKMVDHYLRFKFKLPTFFSLPTFQGPMKKKMFSLNTADVKLTTVEYIGNQYGLFIGNDRRPNFQGLIITY